MFLNWIKNEFRWKKFRLQHDHLHVFVYSEWVPNKWFCAWRTLAALYLTSSTLTIIRGYNRGITFIFMTNWSYITLTLYFINAASASLWYAIRDSRTTVHFGENKCEIKLPKHGRDLEDIGERSLHTEQPNQGRLSSSEEPTTDIPAHENDTTRTNMVQLPVKVKTLWVLFYIASTASVVVTLSFWILLFRDFGKTSFKAYAMLSTHLFNSVFMIIENILCSIPMNYVHVCYPLLFFVLYLVFTVVYWSLGGMGLNNAPYIYPFLNYSEKPTLAVIMVLCMTLIFIPICFTIHYLIYLLRCKLLLKFTSKNKTTPQNTGSPEHTVNISTV